MLRGKHTVWGGRGGIRAVLYLAALAPAPFSPAIKALHDRRCAAGKAKEVALTTCMRQLLTIRHAMLARRTPWRSAAAPVVG